MILISFVIVWIRIVCNPSTPPTIYIYTVPPHTQTSPSSSMTSHRCNRTANFLDFERQNITSSNFYLGYLVNPDSNTTVTWGVNCSFVSIPLRISIADWAYGSIFVFNLRLDAILKTEALIGLKPVPLAPNKSVTITSPLESTKEHMGTLYLLLSHITFLNPPYK